MRLRSDPGPLNEAKVKAPAFLRFLAPSVETLGELGAWGTAAEVTDRVTP
jgi:hypothetical protein